MANIVNVAKLLKGGLSINLSGITTEADGTHVAPTEKWQLVALVGIYKELQKLNQLLACPNFTGIPQTLRDIKRGTNRIPTIARPRKSKVKK